MPRHECITECSLSCVKSTVLRMRSFCSAVIGACAPKRKAPPRDEGTSSAKKKKKKTALPPGQLKLSF
eukprot:5398461-Prymnesium_polylepis.2